MAKEKTNPELWNKVIKKICQDFEYGIIMMEVKVHQGKPVGIKVIKKTEEFK